MSMSDATYVLLRIAAGILFMQHGLQKIFGLLGGKAVPLVSLMGLAGVLELVGGALLLVGLLTRPVAFVLAGEMVVAYFMAHASKAAWPIQNGGEPALLFAIIFMFFAGNGAGRLSLDAWRRQRRGHTSLVDARARRAA